MAKKLIVCNTYFQLILAIQLKLTLFRHDCVDITLTDHSIGMERVADRLRELFLFDNVKYTTTKADIYGGTRISQIIDVLKANWGKNNCNNFELYDEIVFNGLSLGLYAIFDYYNGIGHNCDWSMMEEGILSYEQDFLYGNRVKITRFIRKIQREPDLASCVGRYYCCFPDVKKERKGIRKCQIPLLNENIEQVRNIIAKVFECHKHYLNEKYIFFGSAFDYDGHMIKENEIVRKLYARLKDKLIVKFHPRGFKRDSSIDGIKIMEATEIPWEAMQIINDYEDKTLITLVSGAFISITALLDQGTQGFFLFPEIKELDSYTRTYISGIEAVLAQLHEKGLCENIKIGTLEDITGE